MSRKPYKTLFAAATVAAAVGVTAGPASAANQAASGAGATASASSWFLSRAQATSIAQGIARKKALAHVDAASASCYPSFRPRTARDLQKRWHMWDCGWALALSKPDGSTAMCTGKVRITGKVSGTKYSVLKSPGCKPTSGPSPTPQPQPTPTPTPTPGGGGSGGGPAQTDILNHVAAWAAHMGASYLSPETHTFSYSVNGCKMIKADTARCTVWRWVDHGIVGTDAGRQVHQIDFYRVYAFSQWLTANGIYDDYTQTFDFIDPAQSCLSVDHQNLYGCTPLVPGAG